MSIKYALAVLISVICALLVIAISIGFFIALVYAMFWLFENYTGITICGGFFALLFLMTVYGFVREDFK